MKVKKFQSISKFLSYFFKLAAILSIIAAALSLGSYFFDLLNFESISFVVEMDSTLSIFFSDGSITDLEYAKAGLLVGPFFLILMSYLFIQASTLFDRLVTGETPFTFDFAKKVKKISYFLVIIDLIVSLFYTLLVNLIADTGNYFYMGLSYLTLIGLILYLVSGILNYGVQLQKLSDQTV